MSPFQPAGDRARWRILYDLIHARGVGHVLTYGELGEALDLDPDGDRHMIQMAMRRAARESEEQDNRALDSVPNVGYRIVQPPEHLRLAKAQQKRSTRALKRGHSKVVHVDLAGLEPETRKAFEVVAQAFAMQMDLNRRTDVRQRNLEQTMRSITETTARSAEEIAELRARLDRLERGQDRESQP